MKTTIQTPTPNLQQSLDFYQKLGFQIIKEGDLVWVSDGGTIIEINANNLARAGVKLYSDNWEDTINSLDSSYHYIKTAEGYIINDPSGCWIYLIERTDSGFILPEEKTGILGNYAGISLESLAFEQSIALWKHLGFSVSMGSADQGWICLTNPEGTTISIMKALICPHLFFNPSLSYFNSGNNPAIISKIKDLQIPITEEITVFNTDGAVDNIIIRDPGGLGFFIFND
ncbi:MAG: hypothetical protein JEZ03_14215 [Bacteroidales bacterium]|nr:hypothetical protein [Bacteroidales bacterium]